MTDFENFEPVPITGHTGLFEYLQEKGLEAETNGHRFIGFMYSAGSITLAATTLISNIAIDKAKDVADQGADWAIAKLPDTWFGSKVGRRKEDTKPI